MKKGTPLWKALIFEWRVPWRYKFKWNLFSAKFMRYFNNINSKKYWDYKFKNEKSEWEQNQERFNRSPYEILVKYLPKEKKFSLLDVGCALREKMGVAGRKRVEKYFTNERKAKEYVEVYKELLK